MYLEDKLSSRRIGHIARFPQRGCLYTKYSFKITGWNTRNSIASFFSFLLNIWKHGTTLYFGSWKLLDNLLEWVDPKMQESLQRYVSVEVPISGISYRCGNGPKRQGTLRPAGFRSTNKSSRSSTLTHALFLSYTPTLAFTLQSFILVHSLTPSLPPSPLLPILAIDVNACQIYCFTGLASGTKE